jgi:redox-sensitive bicupin YhaK (pirin superfamily)
VGEHPHRGFETVTIVWVNLPAKDKMAAPRYQSIVARQIPSLDLAGARGTARIIAGEFAGAKGPAKTFTPIHVWDLRLGSDQQAELAVPDGYTTALVVLRGAVRVNGAEAVQTAEVGCPRADHDRVRRRRDCSAARWRTAP